METYTKKEQELISKQQLKLRKFKISYYYLATGMEGVPNIYPEKIIEAPTKELAAYIYSLMFFSASSVKEVKRCKDSKIPNFCSQSFSVFLNKPDVYRYWGMSIKECKTDLK